jgi:hypothetical protein
MTATGGGRVYERYAWVVLLVSAVLGLLAGLTLVLSPLSIMVEPAFAAGNVPAILRTLGLTWIFFNVLELIVLFRNFRGGERWAWWVLWLLPILWLFHFLFNPATVHNLVIAVVTALGLILSYRAFFSASGRQPSRVS